MHLQHNKPLPPTNAILKKAMPDVKTNYENITLHYIRNLHIGAIVLNIINISVTAKNGSFFINMASHVSYNKFSNVTVWSKE